MTHLRRIMLEELQRRHYSQATTQRYIRFVERFAVVPQFEFRDLKVRQMP